MKMLYHSIVFPEIVFGLANFVEPKFTVLHPVFLSWLFVFLSLGRILNKNTLLHTQNQKLRIKSLFILYIWSSSQLLLTRTLKSIIFSINILKNSKYICKDQNWLESRTRMDPGPRSPNNKFIECRRES